jgi:hypothetical protein
MLAISPPEKPVGGFKNEELWCYFHVLMSMIMGHTEYVIWTATNWLLIALTLFKPCMWLMPFTSENL